MWSGVAYLGRDTPSTTDDAFMNRSFNERLLGRVALKAAAPGERHALRSVAAGPILPCVFRRQDRQWSFSAVQTVKWLSNCVDEKSRT